MHVLWMRHRENNDSMIPLKKLTTLISNANPFLKYWEVGVKTNWNYVSTFKWEAVLSCFLSSNLFYVEWKCRSGDVCIFSITVALTKPPVIRFGCCYEKGIMLPLNMNAELWYEFVTCQKHQKREQFLEKAACEERNGAQVNEAFFFLRTRWELEGRFLLCSVFWLTFIAIGLWPLRNDRKQNPEVIPQLSYVFPTLYQTVLSFWPKWQKADARKLNCKFYELMLPQRRSDSINNSKVCSLFICISLGGKMPN